MGVVLLGEDAIGDAELLEALLVHVALLEVQWGLGWPLLHLTGELLHGASLFDVVRVSRRTRRLSRVLAPRLHRSLRQDGLLQLVDDFVALV